MKLNLAKNQDNVSNLKDIIGHKIFGRFNTHQCDNVPSGEHSVAKGWVGAPNVPKILAMPEGGGSSPCQDLFGGFVHNALRALQSDNFPPKVCPYSPE